MEKKMEKDLQNPGLNDAAAEEKPELVAGQLDQVSGGLSLMKKDENGKLVPGNGRQMNIELKN